MGTFEAGVAATLLSKFFHQAAFAWAAQSRAVDGGGLLEAARRGEGAPCRPGVQVGGAGRGGRGSARGAVKSHGLVSVLNRYLASSAHPTVPSSVAGALGSLSPPRPARQRGVVQGSRLGLEISVSTSGTV